MGHNQAEIIFLFFNFGGEPSNGGNPNPNGNADLWSICQPRANQDKENKDIIYPSHGRGRPFIKWKGNIVCCAGGQDPALAPHNPFLPITGTIFYSPDVNHTGDYLFIENDIQGHEINNLKRTYLLNSYVESVQVRLRPGHSPQRLFGLNMRFCNYTYGVYKDREGILIPDVITDRDYLRDLTVARPTRFPPDTSNLVDPIYRVNRAFIPGWRVKYNS